MADPQGTVNDEIRALTRAIEADPHAAVNYLLRAEEWLRLGEIQHARADFLAAQGRAQVELEHAAWEFIVQAYIDRARDGLHRDAD